MSSCLLVWLAGTLDFDLAPVGGVLASSAPPAKCIARVRACVAVSGCLCLMKEASNAQMIWLLFLLDGLVQTRCMPAAA